MIQNGMELKTIALIFKVRKEPCDVNMGTTNLGLEVYTAKVYKATVAFIVIWLC